MENLRQVLKVLAEKTCESIVLMHQPIPQRVWMRLKDSNGMKLPSHGEQCVYWEPYSYVFVRTISQSPLLTKVAEALQEIPEIKSKITIDTSNELFNITMATWIWDRVLEPYLNLSVHTYRLITFTDEIFEQVFANLISHIHALNPHFTRRICPLLSIRVPREIQLDAHTRIRPLALSESEAWYNNEHIKIMGQIQPQRILCSHCTAEFTYEEPRVDGAGRIKNISRDFVLNSKLLRLLRLISNEQVAFLFTDTTTESVLNTHYHVMAGDPSAKVSVLPERTAILTEEQIQLLIQLWQNLETNANSKTIALAFRRWTDAHDRRTDDDKLVDYWVGLESLFVPDSTQEVKFRATLRIAAFLGKTAEERAEIYEIAKSSYDWRSSIVHGGEPSKKLVKNYPLNQITPKISGYLRQAILQIFQMSEKFDMTKIEKHLLADSILTDFR